MRTDRERTREREREKESVTILAQVHCTRVRWHHPWLWFKATQAAQLAWPAAGGVRPVLNFGAAAPLLALAGRGGSGAVGGTVMQRCRS